MTTSTTTLTDFLLARGEAGDVKRIADLRAEVEALPDAGDRAVLHPALDLALRIRAAVYADHPAYDESWRP